MIKGVHHVGISTANLQRLARFYCDVLGFEPEFEIQWEAGTLLGDMCDGIIGLKNSTARAMKLRLGDMRVELFEYESPAPKPIPADWCPADHGYTHLCLEVADIDAEYQRLKEAGMSFHVPPGPAAGGMRSIYGRDPEGHVIELLEYLPE